MKKDRIQLYFVVVILLFILLMMVSYVFAPGVNEGVYLANYQIYATQTAIAQATSTPLPWWHFWRP